MNAALEAARTGQGKYQLGLVPRPSELQVLAEKLTRAYDVGDRHLELILYWDWESETPLTANEPPFGNPASFLPVLGNAVRASLRAANPAPSFRAVHYFRRRDEEIVASFHADKNWE